VLTEGFGIELKRPPSDSASRYSFQHVDVAVICVAIRDWKVVQNPALQTILINPSVMAKPPRLDRAHQRGCFLRSLLKSPSTRQPWASPSLKPIHIGEDYARCMLQKLLVMLDLEITLIPADVLHTQQVFFDSSRRYVALR